MTPPNGNEVEMKRPSEGEATPKCIYCLRSGGPFNREHVIPKAFGLYGPKTMVLNDTVCAECNEALGTTIDQVLSRDSYEALLRAELLPRVNKKRDRFRPRRTIVRYPDEPKFGDFRGLRLEVDWAIRRLRLLGEIVVLDHAGVRRAFTIEESRGADLRLFRDRPPNAIQIFAPSLEIAMALQHEAEALGARFKQPTDLEVPRELTKPTVILGIEGTIDLEVWRAIAKIAFNYLACIEGPGFVLGASFDEIREFIRSGSLPAPVGVSREPILVGFRHGQKQVMHVVLVDRNQLELRARVSLFNSFSYDVRLSRSTAVWYPLRSGHTFDPIAHTVQKLISIPRALALPRIVFREDVVCCRGRGAAS